MQCCLFSTGTSASSSRTEILLEFEENMKVGPVTQFHFKALGYYLPYISTTLSSIQLLFKHFRTLTPYIYLCIHTYIQRHIQTYTHTYTCKYMHTYVHIYFFISRICGDGEQGHERTAWSASREGRALPATPALVVRL